MHPQTQLGSGRDGRPGKSISSQGPPYVNETGQEPAERTRESRHAIKHGPFNIQSARGGEGELSEGSRRASQPFKAAACVMMVWRRGDQGLGAANAHCEGTLKQSGGENEEGEKKCSRQH